MKLTDRDKILALVLPALIIAVAYGVLSLRVKLVDLTKAEAALIDAKSKELPAAQLAAQQRELAKLQQEINQTEARLQSLREQWRAAATSLGDPAYRNDRVEKLTALLKKYDLELIEDIEAEANKDGKVSTAVERLAQKMTKGTATPKLHLRAIRLHGRYVQVRDALYELGHGEVLAIPVGLTMKTNPESARREWTLLIWI